MQRREFITLLGGAAAWPISAHAQQDERMRRAGMLLGGGDDQVGQANIAAFRDEMAKHGWVEGRNLRTDIRFGGADAERIRVLAVELLRLMPDAIVTSSCSPWPSC